MNCNKCGKADFYIGFFGPDCANPSCSNFKNGKISGISALSATSLPKKKTFKVGDKVEVHRGPDFNDGKEDNFWMEGVITIIVAIDGLDPENPGYVVRLTHGDGRLIPPDFYWSCSGGGNIRHLS